MSKSTKLPNSSTLPETMADVISKVPQGKALALLAQYGPQVFNQVLQEDQRIVKLDNIAQSLQLNTPELYSFNAAVENVGGDWNEVTNLYQAVQKLTKNDPKNTKKLNDIIKYTGIKHPIDKHGLVAPDFLKQLSNSNVLPLLDPAKKTELYDILGIKHGDGIERLLSQGPGKLIDSAHFFEKIAPNAAQIKHAHQTVSLYSKGKDLFRNQVHMSEDDDFLSKVLAEKTENFLIQHADSINQGEKIFTGNPIPNLSEKLLDPQLRKEASAFAKTFSDTPERMPAAFNAYLVNPEKCRAQKAKQESLKKQEAEQEQGMPLPNFPERMPKPFGTSGVNPDKFPTQTAKQETQRQDQVSLQNFAKEVGYAKLKCPHRPLSSKSIFYHAGKKSKARDW